MQLSIILGYWSLAERRHTGQHTVLAHPILPKINRPAVKAMQFLLTLEFLAATMPLSATFINIFGTNCCCRIS